MLHDENPVELVTADTDLQAWDDPTVSDRAAPISMVVAGIVLGALAGGLAAFILLTIYCFIAYGEGCRDGYIAMIILGPLGIVVGAVIGGVVALYAATKSKPLVVAAVALVPVAILVFVGPGSMLSNFKLIEILLVLLLVGGVIGLAWLGAKKWSGR